jgi:DNA-binding winged helix-turn-helix (wHTH) protein/Tol biopolymer transport system component
MPPYRFGPFLLDPEKRLLVREGEAVSLPPKAFDLLLLLVSRSGRVVTRDEILREVWNEAEFVEEWNLTQHVYTLRAVLGDRRGRPKYIETVPRRGYRFAAEVSEAGRGKEAVTTAETRELSFRQLTYRRGAVLRARFAPDGRAVLYGAAFGGMAPEVYLTDSAIDAPESRQLGLTDANLLAVSPAGELAVSLGDRTLRGYVRGGALALTSLFSGAPPRPLLGGVQEAEWSPDGARLVVVREVAGRTRLECPAGTILYETGGWVSHPRFSTGGDLIAFIDHPLQNDDRGSVAVVAGDRGVRLISGDWISVQGLAWSNVADEVWFTATKLGNARALYAVTLAGRERLVQRMAGALTLQDVSRDGRVLLTRQNTRIGIICLPPGETRERDLAWLDWSLARDLSDDGRTLLFTEAGEGGGATYGVYVRGTDGSPAVRLGNGSALALSPDGKWALARSTDPPTRLILLPTGVGEPRALESAPLSYQQWACWFPDSRRILFTANAPGRGSQLFLQDVSGGPPRCITPHVEGVYLTTPHAISPDGTLIAAVGPDEKLHLYGAEGSYRDAPGLAVGDAPIRWAVDGRSLFVYSRRELPARLYLLDLATGVKTLRHEIMPPDPTGVVEILRVLLTPGGESYAYTYTRDLSDLYVVSGLG